MTPQSPGFVITRGKGFHITFANGWTVSVQMGWASYCQHHDCDFHPEKCRFGPNEKCGENGSSDAEVAAWGPDGKMIDLGDDTVRGWQTPAAILALLNAAANGELATGKIPPEERSDR